MMPKAYQVRFVPCLLAGAGTRRGAIKPRGYLGARDARSGLGTSVDWQLAPSSDRRLRRPELWFRIDFQTFALSRTLSLYDGRQRPRRAVSS